MMEALGSGAGDLRALVASRLFGAHSHRSCCVVSGEGDADVGHRAFEIVLLCGGSCRLAVHVAYGSQLNILKPRPRFQMMLAEVSSTYGCAAKCAHITIPIEFTWC